MSLPRALRDLFALVDDFCDLAESEERRQRWALSRTGRVLLELLPVCQQILQAFHEEDYERVNALNAQRLKLLEQFDHVDPLDVHPPDGKHWGRQ